MRSARVAAVAVLAAFGGATDGRAQSSAELDRIEAALEAGALGGLRESLERVAEGAGDASPEMAGRVRFLRARLMSDVDSARSEYLRVAIDGRSSYGALAWLRLAQLELANGEPARAVENLSRMQVDYPTSHVATAWYWRGRAFESGGLLDEACFAFDRALAEASALGEALVGELAVAKRNGCEPGGLRFTLQIGAFSASTAAESLASTARALGFPVRVVEDDGLEKVRVGRFASPESARLLEGRLRRDGFSVAIVAAES